MTISAIKVLRGQQGHLFLDNDVNVSVDQYTGRMILGVKQAERWKRYFQEVIDICPGSVSLLVAPSKEEVFYDLYPHPRGDVTAIDQLLAMAGKLNLLYPRDALIQHRDLAYSRTNTHWSAYGARLAMDVYLRSLGLSAAADALPDTFVPKQGAHDLGSKLSPSETSVMLHQANLPAPTYDNGIHNHGRIWIYSNPSAMLDQCIMVFGDSFSVNAVPYLPSVFRRVIYSHTAASIDLSLVDKERPEHILLQIAQRFIPVAPSFIDIWMTIERKIAVMDTNLIETAAKVRTEPEPYYSHRMADLFRRHIVI